MRYLKATVLPAATAIIAFAVLIWLQALAVRQYFEDGFGRTIGEAVWGSRIPSYVLLATLSISALWAGYRAARSGRRRVAALVSGPLVILMLAGFWFLVLVIVQGISEMQVVLGGAGLAQTGFIAFAFALAAGAIGAWASGRRTIVT